MSYSQTYGNEGSRERVGYTEKERRGKESHHDRQMAQVESQVRSEHGLESIALAFRLWLWESTGSNSILAECETDLQSINNVSSQ